MIISSFLRLLALSLFIATSTVAQSEIRVGTVDMARVFKDYSKTRDAEAKISEARSAAKREFDERADAYKKALDEVNKLNQQLESPALTADKKPQLARDRDERISNIKKMEREVNDFRQTRERQLQEQMLRMRESILKEITDVVMIQVRAKNLDLVFDKSGPSMNGFPVILFSRAEVDFTDDVLTALNKKDKATSSTQSSSAGTPPSKPR